MLEAIKLKFSEEPVSLNLDAKGVTIFVGPNNSGKSLILNELFTLINRSEKPGNLKIVDDIEILWPSESDINTINEYYRSFRPDSTPDNHVFAGRFVENGDFRGNSIPISQILSFSSMKSNKYWISSQLVSISTLKLDGRTRFDLVNNQPMGDLTASTPRNSLTNIFANDELRANIRNTISDTLGIYFVIDPTEGGALKIRLSSIPPAHDEQSLAREAREFHKKALYIKDASDGIQAYVGIVVAVYSLNYKTLLIDEPEAFLHPPLARKLGYTLASQASKTGNCLFTSTHNSDFLIGCLQASKDVRIVRLEYSNGKSKARVVDSATLTKMYQSPLMRSANVFSALFYDGVIVTESDNDRAFYQEIYNRIADKIGNMPSILFINAQNKQTIKDIIGPLRSFGIPAAAITDIDVLKDGGKVWSGWLAAAHVPEALRAGLGVQRGSVERAFSTSGKDMKKDNGVIALEKDDRAAADQFFESLENYGVFVVRIGELENWLLHLKVLGKKADWVISMLNRLGSDVSHPDYVFPEENDVWAFMESISAWIKNPARRGTS